MTALRTPGLHIVIAGLLVMAAARVERASAQPDEFKAITRVETADQPSMEMAYFLRRSQLRMDVSEQAFNSTQGRTMEGRTL